MAISKIENNSLASGVPQRSQLPAGTVLQVVNTISQTAFTTSSTSFFDVGLSLSITPTSSTSKILIFTSLHTDVSGPNGYGIRFVRDATNLFSTWEATTYRNAASFRDNSTFIYYDSPATTSAVTYKIQATTYTASYSITFNESYSPGTYSSLTLMEVAA